MEKEEKINFFGNFFRLTFLFSIFFLILSYFASLFPLFNKISFFVILFLILIFSLERLEYGIYFLFAELFLGSKGYLFYFDYQGVLISLRIALFLIILGVWFFKIFKEKKVKEVKNLFGELKNYLFLFLIVLWGIIWAFFQKNQFQNIFFDANAWFYLLLVFPIFDTIKKKKQIENLLQIFAALVIVLFLKTFFLLWIFSHQIEIAMPSLYQWVRSFGIGEITYLGGNFYRIFLQSQIYNLLAFFIFLILLLKENVFQEKKKFLSLIILSSLVILVSFSRSFWLAFIAILGLLMLYLLWSEKIGLKKLLKICFFLLFFLILEIGFVYLFISFPPVSHPVSFASLVEKRVTTSTFEPAGKSRLNQLGPLSLAIIRHPLLGSGFGKTVTYKSSDPRNLGEDLKGTYTTYAFEWGYLDLWLKIGLLGIFIYFWLLGKVLKLGFQKYQREGEPFLLGIFFALIALIVVHIFTPYLNHPLGFGFLIFSHLIFKKF